jgi:hypothetical protein
LDRAVQADSYNDRSIIGEQRWAGLRHGGGVDLVGGDGAAPGGWFRPRVGAMSASMVTPGVPGKG